MSTTGESSTLQDTSGIHEASNSAIPDSISEQVFETLRERNRDRRKLLKTDATAVLKCFCCNIMPLNNSSCFNHMICKNHEDYFRNLINFRSAVLKASKILDERTTMKQMKAFSTESPLDRIFNDVSNGKELTPTTFSMLLNLVKIRDDHYPKLLQILSRSCLLMAQNPPEVNQRYFMSKEFFQQFINTNMIVDEIWMLRKTYPEMLPKWKTMHRKVFGFRSKLLKFLEKQYGRGWVQQLIERGEEQRVREWPLTP